jgi:hypothetical protein
VWGWVPAGEAMINGGGEAGEYGEYTLYTCMKIK